jgi:hypothetical protein
VPELVLPPQNVSYRGAHNLRLPSIGQALDKGVSMSLQNALCVPEWKRTGSIIISGFSSVRGVEATADSGGEISVVEEELVDVDEVAEVDVRFRVVAGRDGFEVVP